MPIHFCAVRYNWDDEIEWKWNAIRALFFCCCQTYSFACRQTYHNTSANVTVYKGDSVGQAYQIEMISIVKQTVLKRPHSDYVLMKLLTSHWVTEHDGIVQRSNNRIHLKSLKDGNLIAASELPIPHFSP